MRNPLPMCAALLLLCGACESDADPQAPAGEPAGSQPRDVDGGSPATPPPEATQASAPPFQDGKKLYNVRFDVRAGDAPFGCGKPALLGTASTLAEPTDLRFYVHDVTLIRANGERVPLTLYQDGRYQRENVALLDFADDSGKCATGNTDIRSLVEGYAPEHPDYRSVEFKLGVPADKNHLDGAVAPAPYNATGMWWSWSGGYKYMRMDLTSAVQDVWYFHGGAAGCSGLTTTGFTCAARQLATIVLDDYDPERSLVVFDVAKFYAGADLSQADATPGCMGAKDDADCKPLYSALGVVPWDDQAPRPTQTAFSLKLGAPLVASTEAKPATRSARDPSFWPDPTFQRPAALDVPNISKAGETRSHPVGDPRHGISCMRCHQQHGPGVGLFTAAGSIFDHEGKPATGVKIEIVGGTPNRAGHHIENFRRYELLEVDAHGNFFTTEPLPYAQEKLTARVLAASDERVLMTMFSTKQTGACNTCHTAGFRITLPPL